MTDNAADLGELTFVRIVDAPRELVFHCMTDPDHLTHFWGPIGMSAPREEIVVDLRPGGVFATVMVNDADGSRYPTRGIFDEVAEPERLVWTEPDSGMTTESTFTDLGDGRTEMRIHQTKVPAFFRSPEAQAGFLTSLDKFDAYLGTLDKSGPRRD
jgi:uncharacterized protein YndB with AHSA1/START domain